MEIVLQTQNFRENAHPTARRNTRPWWRPTSRAGCRGGAPGAAGYGPFLMQEVPEGQFLGSPFQGVTGP